MLSGGATTLNPARCIINRQTDTLAQSFLLTERDRGPSPLVPCPLQDN